MNNSPKEAAKKMGISLDALYDMMTTRSISYIKYSRKNRIITDAEIERVMKRCEVKAV